MLPGASGANPKEVCIFTLLSRTRGDAGRDALELPVLRLGLAGFTREQDHLIAQGLGQARTALQWELVPPERSDALCVNGSRSRAHADGTLEIHAAASGAPSLRIDPRAAKLPLAFSLPFALPGYEAADTFDLGSPFTLRRTLEKFEGWLRPTSLQFCLAAQIVQERIDVSTHVYHVSVQGRLIAVVSPRTGIAVLPIASPTLVAQASWARRPDLAAEMPGHFERTSLPEALWRYAMRTRRELLPASWRSGPLYWCRPPAVPHRMLRDAHLLIVRELVQAPASFADLARRTGLAEPELARHLAALSVVGSVTNDRKRAPASHAGFTPRLLRGGRRSEPVDADKTAPVPLQGT